MATESGPTTRNLWQLPLFLLGIAALIGVWFGRPLWRLTPVQQYEHDLTALRQTIDKVPVDIAQVQSLLRKVQGIDPPPPLEVQAPFVIGSAMVVVAESDLDSEDAVLQWKTARQLLESVVEKSLPDGDQARLKHRLAKCWYYTGEPAAKVIAALTGSLTSGDDPSEANRILAQLYLKLTPPDNKKARDCLKEYLGHILPGRSESQQRVVNEARLLYGKLCIQLGETEEARKSLEKIGPDALPSVLIEARVELGKSYAQEEDWDKAIRCSEQAYDVRAASAAQRANILYLLAEYYLKANQTAKAIAALEQLRKTSGPEGLAAGLKLAQLQLRDPKKYEDAANTLESVFGSVNGPVDYQNKLMPLADARAIFEEAVLKLRTAKAFALALRVARAMAPIAEKGHDRELAAETLQLWGESQLDRIAEAEGAERPVLEAEGTQHVRDAAKEWRQVAALRTSLIEKGDALQRAADLYLKAGDKDEAMKTLDELLFKVPDLPPERLTEIWLKKGEFFLALDNREQAKICFQNGIQNSKSAGSPALLRCRIRLTEVLLKGGDAKQLSQAIAELEKAFSDPEVAKDKELHARIAYFIADAYYQQKDFRRAEVAFLRMLGSYPDSPKALLARYQLGQCYWGLAREEAGKCAAADAVVKNAGTSEEARQNAKASYDASYKQYLEELNKAFEPFKIVEAQLLNGMTNPKLSLADADLLRRASLSAADCAFHLGKEDSIARYDTIATRYAGSITQLEALRCKYKCCRYYEKNPDKASEALTQMRTAFLNMPDTEFDNSADVRTRAYWQTWFDKLGETKK